MKNFFRTVLSTLLVITTTLTAYQTHESLFIHQINDQPIQVPDLRTLSYDEVMDLMSQIESDSFGERYSADELDKINQFISFLAMEGASNNGKIAVERDIASLFQQGTFYYALLGNLEFGYTNNPAVYVEGGLQDFILCKSWFKKRWDETRSFVKKYKKEIIIGTIVVVTVAVVAVAAATISSSSAGAVATAGGALASSEIPTRSTNPQNEANHDSLSKAPQQGELITSSLRPQISTFKETIAQEQFAAAQKSNGISMEENGRIIGSLFAHKAVDGLMPNFDQNPTLKSELKDSWFNSQCPAPGWAQAYPNGSTVMPHDSIDLAFSTDYKTSYAGSSRDLNTTVYEARGNLALNSECYTQAEQDFGKAISLDPSNPTLYLERGIANFKLGNYEQSIADYNQFVEKKAEPFSVTDFSLGFAKGVPKGAYESGKGALLFLSDFVTHPVQTSKQVVDSIGQLATLVKNDEFGVVAEALSPELHQLVTQWDSLPSETKGELAGYAVGKLGTDFFMPGAVSKIAVKSVNSAKELAAICKNLQIAQETLILETASGVGIPAKVAEIIEMGKNKLSFGEGLGVINKEIKLSSSGLTGIQEKIFLSSVSEKYNEHLTQLAHALSKHSGRKNTFWNKPTGPMNTWHAQALNQIEQICNAPGKFKKVFDASTGLTWIEKRLPNGQGIRLNQDYTFKGFLD